MYLVARYAVMEQCLQKAPLCEKRFGGMKKIQEEVGNSRQSMEINVSPYSSLDPNDHINEVARCHELHH